MVKNIQQAILNVINYVVHKVLLYDLILLGIAALSFVITGQFTFQALSERLFWLGVVVFLIAGTLAMAQMAGGRAIMFPYNIRRPEDAKRFVDEAPMIRERTETRLDLGIQLWLVGIGCLGISALLQTLLA
jgi:hypothetical protein